MGGAGRTVHPLARRPMGDSVQEYHPTFLGFVTPGAKSP